MNTTTYGAIMERTGTPAATAMPPDVRTNPKFHSNAKNARPNVSSGPAGVAIDRSAKPLTAASLNETYIETARACHEHNLQIPYSHTTALALQRIELPQTTTLQPLLHATVLQKRMRRSVINGVNVHMWSALTDSDIVVPAPGLTAVRPLVAWAQMSKFLDLESLIILTESILRHTTLDLDDFRTYVGIMGKFPGKRRCVRALRLARPGADSPKECEMRLRTLQFGMDQAEINYTIPGLAYPNGTAVTLDLAWPDAQVGMEYNGDHHRTDKKQWRRDEWKREAVAAKNWRLFTVTQLDLSDDWHMATLMMRVAAAMEAQTGRRVSITPPMSMEQLADRRRRIHRL
ncbi:hypothetical protein GFD17_01500 [Bifidobacterium sp. SMB2]|uniref:DUF559 domain-containing protein n=1 Tax=Bifidobacterium saimiriisciurei TaxID=2661627 RepID=A0ABX0CC95_9BIFI|nr:MULTISPECIES: hypothetical protein [Bifidobacterium]NEG95448.1 hypothetical protein [Bifidobacterium sp. SMB2]NEH12195.1 hypothetical protein [Bifidobacterium saimiriisciurei]